MAATLRVETPWTYISATASFKAYPFEHRGIEFDAAGLWHLELQRAEPTLDRLGLEAVGVAASVGGPLVMRASFHCLENNE